MNARDERIKREILDRLRHDGRIDASGIRVGVEHGTAVLRGSVSSLESRRIAGEDTWSVHGVSGVRDDLAVEYEGTVPPDEEIELRAARLLEGSPDVDHTTITLSVTGGGVALEGSVPSFWKKLKAGRLVSQVTGVLHVDNRLSVVPSRQETDEALAGEVSAAIQRSPDVLDKEDIEVRVENGTVVLSGTVPTGISRNAAYEAAVYTSGAVDVRNEITVEPMIQGT